MNKITLSLIVVGLLFSSLAQAGLNCVNCTVISVGCSATYAGSQSCNVVVEGTVSGTRPACHTFSEATPRWVIDVSTDGGKTMQALAVAAQLADKPVIVYGLGACNTWANAEDINLIYLGNPL